MIITQLDENYFKAEEDNVVAYGETSELATMACCAELWKPRHAHTIGRKEIVAGKTLIFT